MGSESPVSMVICCVLCYGGFKASYALSFDKGHVFTGIIRYQYVNTCFPFNFVRTINGVDVGVSSLCWIVISDKISHMFNYWSCDLNWYNTIVSWWDFMWWFYCAYCCVSQCSTLEFIVPCFFICLVLECLGVWLHIFGPVSTELTQFFHSFLGFPLVHTLRWNKRGMHIERTITLN